MTSGAVMHLSLFLNRLAATGGVVLSAAASTTCSGGNDLTVPEEPDPAAIVVVAGDGQRGVVGEALPGELVVYVSDKAGHDIAGMRVEFSLPDGVTGALDPAEAATDADGRAATHATLGTTAGLWEAEATVATLEGPLLGTTFHAVGAAGPPDTLSAIAGDGQSAESGQELTDSLTVGVVDRFGNPVLGVSVVWEPQEGGGVAPANSPTGPTGRSSVSRRLGAVAGPQHTIASVAGAHGSPITFTHTALKGAPAALLYVSGDAQSTVAGRQLADLLAVKLNDASGNPLEGVSISWFVATGGGSAAPTSSETNADGIATSTWTLGSLLGRQTLLVSLPGLGDLIFEATALPAGSPASVTITTQPSGAATSGEVFAVQPVIEVRDQDQNLDDGAVVDASIESGGGALSGTTEVATQNGVATFTDLAIAGLPGPRTLRFTAGAASAVSAPISLTSTSESDRIVHLR